MAAARIYVEQGKSLAGLGALDPLTAGLEMGSNLLGRGQALNAGFTDILKNSSITAPNITLPAKVTSPLAIVGMVGGLGLLGFLAYRLTR